MTLREFFSQNNVAFVKPTANNNGLNFRTQEGRLVGTTLISEVPVEDEILAWVKERLTWNCNIQETESGNIMLRISKPRVVDYGLNLAGLFEDEPAKSSKKVKA